jgi:prepilin-type N-terminal cleavage/methylation domain-containing protein
MDNHNNININGFTLLEVLVAFSLMAVLLTVIIQSQGETVYFLEKTQKLSLVQNEVTNELLITERTYSGDAITNGNGVFPADHPLAGDRWEREVTQQDFMGIIPIMKVTFRVLWKPPFGKEEQSFEAYVLGEER